mmetsp:Transcript_22297/g.29443  ORF Transcript_22297/g.29443 Transcript_22297/m.29443 type:complete len:169 (-) Transcript_22297:341-847(-)
MYENMHFVALKRTWQAHGCEPELVCVFSHKSFVLFVFYSLSTSIASLILLLMKFGRYRWSLIRPTMSDSTNHHDHSSSGTDEDVSPTHVGGGCKAPVVKRNHVPAKEINHFLTGGFSRIFGFSSGRCCESHPSLCSFPTPRLLCRNRCSFVFILLLKLVCFVTSFLLE